MKLATPKRTRAWLAALTLVALLSALAAAWVARRAGLHPLRTLRTYAAQVRAQLRPERQPQQQPQPPQPLGPVEWPAPLQVSEWLYHGGRNPAWDDWGWSKHEYAPNAPARIQLENWGGLRLVNSHLPGSSSFGGLTFRYRVLGTSGRVLRVQLGDSHDSSFPQVVIAAAHERPRSDGFADVFVPMPQLNPDQLEFSHVVLMADAMLDAATPIWLEVDDLGLSAAPPPSAAAAKAPERAARWELACSAEAKPISPWIYGIGAAHDQKGDDEWWLSASIRRWGGNPTSRYNWQLGNAWNTASDWYFENVDYVGTEGYSYRDFLRANRSHDMRSALTVPLLGWVAKDTSSVSFPRSRWPNQSQFDEYRPEAGNGMQQGAALPAVDPEATSVAAPPAFVRAWVETIAREAKQTGERTVHQYILDNEPNLWSSTHRDIRAEHLGYDELLDRTLSYGTAVREADPEAIIAGPAEWGWPNYFRSDKDMASGSKIPWDQLRHGAVPLVPWYLKKLAEHEQKTGVRLLNLLDLHFYPQADRVHSNASDAATSALRIRSTRGLWDPSYVDESWIAEPVQLLPRMREWIEDNYPGCGTSIGEWSFGGERHMSGALAAAEALGRFGTQGVTSAFYWSSPPKASPAAWAFRAYRNFDGQGGRAEDWSIPARLHSGTDTSVFVTRDAASRRWVLILLNFDPKRAASLAINTSPCLGAARGRVFVYTGQAHGFDSTAIASSDGSYSVLLPPYAIGVLELSSDR